MYPGYVSKCQALKHIATSVTTTWIRKSDHRPIIFPRVKGAFPSWDQEKHSGYVLQYRQGHHSCTDAVYDVSKYRTHMQDNYRPRSEGDNVLGSVRPSVRLSDLSRLNRLTNKSHYQSKVFVCVSVISRHMRIVARMRSNGF